MTAEYTFMNRRTRIRGIRVAWETPVGYSPRRARDARYRETHREQRRAYDRARMARLRAEHEEFLNGHGEFFEAIMSFVQQHEGSAP
jgi:hypothetical protein